jgi:VanZ family protein
MQKFNRRLDRGSADSSSVRMPAESWRTLLRRWLPVILWAGLIFYFSTENFSFSKTEGFFSDWLRWLLPEISPAQFMALHLGSRKGAHWFEYFILAILLLRAQRRGNEPRLAIAAIARTLVWVLAYAVSDEYHQSWVPERTASAVDVAIDTFGGLCGVFWICFRYQRRAAT